MTTFPNTSSGSLKRSYPGQLRPSQIITTFGPGAVVDFSDESVMVAGIDTWTPGPMIHEPRLEKALDVDGFRMPRVEKRDRKGDVRCVRFPSYLVCPNCGRLLKRHKCGYCNNGATYPARLIILCPKGHADDFPWYWWVHRQGRCTGNPALRLTNQKRTAALADLVVRCDTCNKNRSLAGALGPKALENFTCTGKRPWLIDAPDEQCSQKIRSVLRGASNVYFSSLFSALSIPPWSERIHIVLNDHWNTLRSLSEEFQRMVIENLREQDFASFNMEDVIRAINERLNYTATKTSLRAEEFRAFRNPGVGISTQDFQIRREPIHPAFQTTIAQIVLVSRLRELSALRGFTRIDPPDSDDADQELIPISLMPQKWLPAIENRGEGIFIELDLDKVQIWEKLGVVQERVGRINQAYAVWREQRGLPLGQQYLPRTILVHTLAHLLIRQLSLECGYSSSSLRERIYSSPDGCGLLIYTASSDSDGSLGGLVQQGRKDRFFTTMRALLEHAQWCSSDPLCMEHNPSLTGKLNGASCHACSLVAETSCELSNHMLDRALIRDLADLRGTGYFT